MPILLGPFDPIKLVFNVINELLEKRLISYEEARRILRNSLDPNMPEIEKEKLLDSIIRRTNV